MSFTDLLGEARMELAVAKDDLRFHFPAGQPPRGEERSAYKRYLDRVEAASRRVDDLLRSLSMERAS